MGTGINQCRARTQHLEEEKERNRNSVKTRVNAKRNDKQARYATGPRIQVEGNPAYPFPAIAHFPTVLSLKIQGFFVFLFVCLLFVVLFILP